MATSIIQYNELAQTVFMQRASDNVSQTKPFGSDRAAAFIVAFFAGEPTITPPLTIEALAAAIPVPATSAPPGVTDTGAVGSSTTMFARADHTHQSKARKARVTTATDGTVTWTYPTPFGSGVVPIVVAIAEAASGVTDVINVQLVGTPTNTSCSLLVNRTSRSVVALIGLTVLSIPASVGAQVVHAVALEP